MQAAIVTGGASGIGAAVVARLLAAGWSVAVLDLRVDSLPDGVCGVATDVAEEAAVTEAVATAVRTVGAPVLAVLAAGVGGMSPLLKMTAAEWDRVHGVNARGLMLSMREAARAMVTGGAGGSIVAVTSISGSQAERTMSHYDSSKAAANSLVRVAARELGPYGIRVNAVAPGTTDTPMFTATEALPGYREQVGGRAALGGVGTAEDVAGAILAVASTPWVTGQIVAADGGVSLWSPIDPLEAMDR